MSAPLPPDVPGKPGPVAATGPGFPPRATDGRRTVTRVAGALTDSGAADPCACSRGRTALPPPAPRRPPRRAAACGIANRTTARRPARQSRAWVWGLPRAISLPQQARDAGVPGAANAEREMARSSRLSPLLEGCSPRGGRRSRCGTAHEDDRGSSAAARDGLLPGSGDGQAAARSAQCPISLPWVSVPESMPSMSTMPAPRPCSSGRQLAVQGPWSEAAPPSVTSM